MAIITGYSAEKMDEFNNASVVGGSVNSAGSLILKTRGGTNLDAGDVKGPKGDLGNTGAAGLNGIPGGTTATRNAKFPLPTTVAATAALANQVITWYNTTTGMFETYYATNNTAGLTVPGVTVASGWYENTYLSKFPKGVIKENFISGSTGPLDLGGANWYIADKQAVSLVAGRRYRVYYKTTHSAAAGNMAIAWELYQTATTDTTIRSGTIIEDQWTMYASPVGSQGKIDIMEFSWIAATTGTFNLKLVCTKATLSGTFQLERRRFMVYDEGLGPATIMF